jgi:hypothetical protein
MQRIFTFDTTAVLVRHWFEIDLDDASMEHGCRVELRELAPRVHRGTESAAQLVTIDQPLWRADLFDRLDGPIGSFDAAHYHPHFDGVEPSERVWDDDLTADPWAWLAGQLQTLPEAAAYADEIVAAARRVAPDQCRSVEQCHAWTTDVLSNIEAMIANLSQPDRLDRDHVARWVGA